MPKNAVQRYINAVREIRDLAQSHPEGGTTAVKNVLEAYHITRSLGTVLERMGWAVVRKKSIKWTGPSAISTTEAIQVREAVRNYNRKLAARRLEKERKAAAQAANAPANGAAPVTNDESPAAAPQSTEQLQRVLDVAVDLLAAGMTREAAAEFIKKHIL